jgi:hypothetical protein
MSMAGSKRRRPSSIKTMSPAARAMSVPSINEMPSLACDRADQAHSSGEIRKMPPLLWRAVERAVRSRVGFNTRCITLSGRWRNQLNLPVCRFQFRWSLDADE